MLKIGLIILGIVIVIFVAFVILILLNPPIDIMSDEFHEKED